MCASIRTDPKATRSGRPIHSKGKGTCIGTPAGSDGSVSYACQGEYTLPKP